MSGQPRLKEFLALFGWQEMGRKQQDGIIRAGQCACWWLCCEDTERPAVTKKTLDPQQLGKKQLPENTGA